MDWSKYPNFTPAEFRCKHTGKDGIKPEFMDRLQALRNAYGKPMRISSGYRHTSHPVEARKRIKGTHSMGLACDVSVSGADARELVGLAIQFGFTGIGINQKGASRFIHLDTFQGGANQPRPTIWSY